MANSVVTLRAEHAYLLVGVVGFYFANGILGATIGAARSRHGIKYPNLYATRGMFIGEDGKVDEKKWEEHGVKFNQAQRGHQHLTETEPTALALMLSCGVFYPTYAAVWGAVWVVGSLMYGFGYAVSPNYRLVGEALYIPASLAWVYGLYCAASVLQQGGGSF
ncbi:hypothetical protein BASA81_007577 [Batrachochytrium salamandrivorans]|nr:hypothetical protein BASA81_007577 [Batrachochytrium salamandrivorans]